LSGVFYATKIRLTAIVISDLTIREVIKLEKKISPVDTGLKSGDKDPYVRTFELMLVCNTNVIQV